MFNTSSMLLGFAWALTVEDTGVGVPVIEDDGFHEHDALFRRMHMYAGWHIVPPVSYKEF